jgi:hypothetical protein
MARILVMNLSNWQPSMGRDLQTTGSHDYIHDELYGCENEGGT